MVSTQNRLILWTGPKHSGKTTSASRLVQTACIEGFVIAGILQPPIYDNGELVGFDVLDIQNQKQIPLARRNKGKNSTGSFNFIADGLKFGHTALSKETTKIADLIIIDEFGLLELRGNGWRSNVDTLLSQRNNMILLVVRQELTKMVRWLYKGRFYKELSANEPESINTVIDVLKNNQQLHRKGK